MGYELLSETRPKARKQYNCIWCGEAIAIREVHVKMAGVYDGEFQTNRFHYDCHPAMQNDLRESREDEFEPYAYKRGTTEHR
jgi:hypothetical protein